VKTTVGDVVGIARDMEVVGLCDGEAGSFLDPTAVTGADGGVTMGVPGTEVVCNASVAPLIFTTH
jgi:hypothetical protein